MKCTKPVVVFLWLMKENTDIIILFWGEGDICELPKFRNAHWPEIRLTAVEDIKPWKLFCKTSLNARE